MDKENNHAPSDRNIDTDLVDFIIDIDEDKTNAKIDKLKKAFDKTVEAGANYGKLFNLYLHRYHFLLS